MAAGVSDVSIRNRMKDYISYSSFICPLFKDVDKSPRYETGNDKGKIIPEKVVWLKNPPSK
jgi:hypothetical protein